MASTNNHHFGNHDISALHLPSSRWYLPNERGMPVELLLLHRWYSLSPGRAENDQFHRVSIKYPLIYSQQTCPGTSVFDPITLQCSASCSGEENDSFSISYFSDYETNLNFSRIYRADHNDHNAGAHYALN